MVDKEEHLKLMTDLLKSGSAILPDHCPECNSPLFRIKGEVQCPRCKRAIKVKEDKKIPANTSSSLIDVERMILTKIQETSKLIMEEKNIVNLEKLSKLLLNWFEALEKATKIRKT